MGDRIGYDKDCAHSRATIPLPPLARLGWNCFSLLTGATSAPVMGAAEAKRNMQESNVRTKTSHLGNMVKRVGR